MNFDNRRLILIASCCMLLMAATLYLWQRARPSADQTAPTAAACPSYGCPPTLDSFPSNELGKEIGQSFYREKIFAKCENAGVETGDLIAQCDDDDIRTYQYKTHTATVTVTPPLIKPRYVAGEELRFEVVMSGVKHLNSILAGGPDAFPYADTLKVMGINLENSLAKETLQPLLVDCASHPDWGCQSGWQYPESVGEARLTGFWNTRDCDQSGLCQQGEVMVGQFTMKIPAISSSRYRFQIPINVPVAHHSSSYGPTWRYIAPWYSQEIEIVDPYQLRAEIVDELAPLADGTILMKLTAHALDEQTGLVGRRNLPVRWDMAGDRGNWATVYPNLADKPAVLDLGQARTSIDPPLTPSSSPPQEACQSTTSAANKLDYTPRFGSDPNQLQSIIDVAAIPSAASATDAEGRKSQFVRWCPDKTDRSNPLKVEVRFYDPYTRYYLQTRTVTLIPPAVSRPSFFGVVLSAQGAFAVSSSQPTTVSLGDQLTLTVTAAKQNITTAPIPVTLRLPLPKQVSVVGELGDGVTREADGALRKTVTLAGGSMTFRPTLKVACADGTDSCIEDGETLTLQPEVTYQVPYCDESRQIVIPCFRTGDTTGLKSPGLTDRLQTLHGLPATLVIKKSELAPPTLACTYLPAPDSQGETGEATAAPIPCDLSQPISWFPHDQIKLEVAFSNTTPETVTADGRLALPDWAELVASDGGQRVDKTLVWTNLSLPPGSTITKTVLLTWQRPQAAKQAFEVSP